MRVALVHDWLLGMRGGERCLEVLGGMFPEADIFTLFYQPDGITEDIQRHCVESSILQRLPGSKSYYRHLFPFYPIGIADLEKKIRAKGYDLVISVSHCVAKNISVPEGTFHLCYCLTPVRYLFDQYDAYFDGKLLEPVIRVIASALRKWDIESAARVHHFVGISHFIRQRIQNYYRRDADVVYPPVRTHWISPRSAEDRGDGFLCANALVPYKNVSLIVDAFNELGLPLTIVGRGPEAASLRRKARPNIRFIDFISDSELADLYRRSKALVFAAEEDFGMVPVEIQAAGRPVICYGRGGVLETVSTLREAPTGIYFSELTTESIVGAIEQFNHRQDEFTVDNCLKQAQKFSLLRFQREITEILERFGFSVEQASDHRFGEGGIGRRVGDTSR